MEENIFRYVHNVRVTVEEIMKRNSKPISKEAREFILSKKDRMGKIERDKTIKRLEMYDRGFREK